KEKNAREIKKVWEKIFSFGSPASFSSKSWTAEAELRWRGGKTAGAELFLFFFYIFVRLCPTRPNADSNKELPFGNLLILS
ncbi:MAG TPA: hypothetical protein VK469_06425, partial [Candidatus Kapabacteria bacterium]|nr:hypothetical protein [Candidatus Kapabacteria bacterium]